MIRGWPKSWAISTSEPPLPEMRICSAPLSGMCLAAHAAVVLDLVLRIAPGERPTGVVALEALVPSGLLREGAGGRFPARPAATIQRATTRKTNCRRFHPPIAVAKKQPKGTS